MPDDAAQTILAPVQADNAVKAQAWQAFKDSKDENDFAQRIGSLNLPQEAKASLWEAKKGGGTSDQAQPKIGPAPKASDMPTFGESWMSPEQRMTMPLAKALISAHDKLREVQNFTQEGRAAHPIQAKLGDIADSIEGFLFGGAQQAEHNIGTGDSGILNNPVVTSLIPGAEGEPALMGVLRGGASLVKSGISALRGGEAAEEAPGIVKQIVKGKNVAQEPAEEALRAGVKAGGEKAGLSTAQGQSIRGITEEPIKTIESSAKAYYKAIDQATDGRFQGNADALDKVNQALRSVTNDAEESNLTIRKERLEMQQDKMFDEAAAKGVSKDTVDKAKASFKQAQALRDLDVKVFKNPNIVAGNAAMGTEETVNVDSAVKALQKLQDNTRWGASRLEQALGTEGAEGLLNDMYAAQRAGVKAMSRQQMLTSAAKWVGIGVGGGGATYEILRALHGNKP